MSKRELAAFNKRSKALDLKRERSVIRAFKELKRLAETMPPRDRTRLVLERAVVELGRYHSRLVYDQTALGIIHRVAQALDVQSGVACREEKP